MFNDRSATSNKQSAVRQSHNLDNWPVASFTYQLWPKWHTDLPVLQRSPVNGLEKRMPPDCNFAILGAAQPLLWVLHQELCVEA